MSIEKFQKLSQVYITYQPECLAKIIHSLLHQDASRCKEGVVDELIIPGLPINCLNISSRHRHHRYSLSCDLVPHGLEPFHIDIQPSGSEQFLRDCISDAVFDYPLWAQMDIFTTLLCLVGIFRPAVNVDDSSEATTYEEAAGSLYTYYSFRHQLSLEEIHKRLMHPEVEPVFSSQGKPTLPLFNRDRPWQPDDYYLNNASTSELDDLHRITMQMAESCLLVKEDE